MGFLVLIFLTCFELAFFLMGYFALFSHIVVMFRIVLPLLLALLQTHFVVVVDFGNADVFLAVSHHFASVGVEVVAGQTTVGPCGNDSGVVLAFVFIYADFLDFLCRWNAWGACTPLIRRKWIFACPKFRWRSLRLCLRLESILSLPFLSSCLIR